MADKRLIPDGIRDLSTEAFNELIDRLGSLDLTPLLVYIIDNVNASALPHLAEQFHVTGNEGWELAQTEEEKRALIKKAIELHRYKGTPWAVKEALKTIGFDVRIFEWFEDIPYPYNLLFNNMEPYQFSCLIKSGKIRNVIFYDIDLEQKLIQTINEYKNVRSHLYQIAMSPVFDAPAYIVAGGINCIDIHKGKMDTISDYTTLGNIGLAGGIVSYIAATEVYMEAV